MAPEPVHSSRAPHLEIFCEFFFFFFLILWSLDAVIIIAMLAVRGDEEGEQRWFKAGGAVREDVAAEARWRESDGARESCGTSGIVSEFGH